MEINIKPVGIVRSCFKEKFGIPRQPGLVEEARGVIEFSPPYNTAHVVRGLEGFSHLWVLFLFHQTMGAGWNPTVRPPRLGGQKRVGVFASRSPFRPNPIGLSVVRLDEIDVKRGKVCLHISAIDLVDGTPVIDIKPYLPYSDAIADALSGYAADKPAHHLEVTFSAISQKRMEEETVRHKDLEMLIVKMLRTDPRPAFYRQKHFDSEFSFKVLDLVINWRVEGAMAIVTDIDTAQ